MPVESQELFRRQIIVKVWGLGKESDPPADFQVAGRLAQHFDFSACGTHQTEQNFQRRGFSGTVGTKKAVDLSFMHRE